MLRNINEYISFIALIIITITGLRLLFGLSFKLPKEITKNTSRFNLFMNYIDNEDE